MEKIVQTAGRDTLGEFAPEFAHFNDDVLFGENWNNHDIDVKSLPMWHFMWDGQRDGQFLILQRQYGR